MIPNLLNVKFYIPRSRSRIIDRPQLVERFINGLECPLTLISAPAGFGKSTLVSAWINAQRNKETKSHFDIVAWLSLDAADNDPVRFWLYFLATLQASYPLKNTSDALPFEELIQVLQGDMPPLLQPVIDRLINSLGRYKEAFLLVLDDYQFIHSAQVHEQVGYLLEHLPPNLRLVIITRTDPPLPLTLFRSRGQLSEFRSADLRFKKAEIARFMETMLGVEISDEDMVSLENSTEGWIAGLQMAALALQALFSQQESGEEQKQLDSVHSFVSSFSGKHIFILDYLTDEVFNRQAEDVQEFLLRSILGRMNAGLCDEVIRAGGAADKSRLRSSKTILEYLEKSNLFVIPLDNEREWFRYHHLFTDLLQVRLSQTWPNLKPELQKRASNWYQHSGNIEEALNYSLAAQDWEQSTTLMESYFQSFLERGQLNKILEWLNRLPADVLASRPRLCIQQAWVLALAQRAKEFVSSLELSGRLIQSMPPDSPGAASELNSAGELKMNHGLLFAYRQVMLGNPKRALEMLQEISRTFPSGYPWEENWLHWMMGYAYRSIGMLDKAADSFGEALRICQEHDNLWNDMICYTDLAMVCHLRGQLKQARDLYQKALDLGRARSVPNHGYLSRVERGLGDLLLDLNKLDEAALHAELGLERSQWWPSANHRAASLCSIGKIQLAKGNLPAASEVIHQADQERQKYPLLPINDGILDYSLVRLWLAQENLNDARQWAANFFDRIGNNFSCSQGADESLVTKLIALARVWMADKKFAQAIELLSTLEGSVRQSQRTHTLIEIGVLQTVALQQVALQLDDKSKKFDPAAISALEKSLELAEPGGYVRLFLDEEPFLFVMLVYLHSQFGLKHNAAYSKKYVESLLAAFPERKTSHNKAADWSLPEALTGRELEVLRLMSAGLSNREMAVKLFLSEGTIKSHVHNLMAKLDAQSRTHALARAKDLKII